MQTDYKYQIAFALF